MPDGTASCRADRAVHPVPIRTVAALLALTLVSTGCADEEEKTEKKAPQERADPPAKPPPGWRTVRNSRAGFTIAIPKSWPSVNVRGRTMVRSDDRLVAVSISADRTARGRKLSAAAYARRTIATVPDFAGIVGKRVSRVPGSRYDSAVLAATGTVNPSDLSQRITVAIFQRPARVSYGVLVFRNAGVKPRFHDRTIGRMLRTFRARPPSG